MGNMSYCRFQNTLGDLRDCYNNWEEFRDAEMHPDEAKARERLLTLCQKIAREYGEA